MISLEEQLLTFSEASSLLPRRRAGKPVHVSYLYRWSTSGCRGVILETVQIGGTRCTSREALDRFFSRLAPQQPAQQTVSTVVRRWFCDWGRGGDDRL